MNTSPVINRRARQHFDYTLLFLSIALSAFGVIAVTVATYSSTVVAPANITILGRITGSYYGARQGLFFLLSPLAVVGMMAIDYRFFAKFTGILYLGGILLLLMVLVMGATTSGVTGWFSLFSGYMLQPSEFAKLSVILFLAKYFARKDNPVENVREFVVMGVIMILPVLLIFSQGELGTVMVFLFVYLVMMLMSGMKLRIIGYLLLVGGLALIPAVLILRSTGSYRYDRLLSFFDPSQASSDAIYQARNAKIAIGNGGLSGAGLFTDGTFTALKYVPQNHTDFIFASVAETMGFAGCMVLIALFIGLIVRLLLLSMNTYDKFARLVIVGVFAMLFFHIFYNLGMTIGITPVMGIPLPFLSYGGSNLIANMAGIGLVLNITLRKPEPRGHTLAEVAGGGVLPKRKKRGGFARLG